MNLERNLFNFRIALDALVTNRFRALLTSLGIIFGVAAVIAMLAIGAGAEREILEQIRQVGSNNIIIKGKVQDPDKQLQEDDKNPSKGKEKRFSPGLSLLDADNISAIEVVSYVSPEIEIEAMFLREGIKNNGKLIGVNNHYFEVAGIAVAEGKLFTENQLETAESVCIIGRNVKARFFPDINPIGQPLKCGNNWLTVVGVLESRTISDASVQKLSIRNLNVDVYIPVKTMLLRYKNRAKVTVEDIKNASQRNFFSNENTPQKKAPLNYHQLDRLVVNIAESRWVEPATDLIGRVLSRRHNEVPDYEIVVPELLLKQEQRTRNLFNVVLAVIASISLLVGGIGIMNIMLASVLERIKEIGLRLSLGARKTDIVMQFMAEAVTISISGGLIGILLGVLISYSIEGLADIQTIVSPMSVVVSFAVSVSVGLLFGIYPARRAAEQDPIESLRHE
ncbi:MAG: ABC transporter permease [Cytophagaceae bacterium]|nr:ABC transporter permease [Cytophagaceae bacterium]